MTTLPLRIVHQLDRGGTEWGLSHYLKRATCPLRATLDKEAQEIRKHRALALVEESRRTVPAKRIMEDSPLLTGLIGHAYLEHWFRASLGQLDPADVVEFDEVVGEKSRQTAQRGVSHYLSVWKVAPFGVVVDVERDVFCNIPCSQAFGVIDIPLTGRIDKLITMTDETITRIKAPLWNVRGNVDALEPGDWIVDYKFRGAKYADEEEKTLLAWQSVAYPHMEQLTGRPVKGSIFAAIVTTKEPSVHLTVVPFPTPGQIGALYDLIRYSSSLPPRQGVPTDDNCWAYHKLCEHHGKGCNARGVYL